MILTEQVKILNDKIKANKAQYDLNRGAAKIFSLSSGELEKYEYLTGEDLGYMPNIIHKVKFEYSPLGKVFNNGLDESDKTEGLLKNIEGKNKKQLEEIEYRRKRQLDVTEGKNKDQLDEIEHKGERQLEAIKKQGKMILEAINKQKKHLKEINNQREELIKVAKKKEKPKEIALLRHNLNDILANYGININAKGEDILRRLANTERIINYNNFFRADNLVADEYDFLKKVWYIV